MRSKLHTAVGNNGTRISLLFQEAAFGHATIKAFGNTCRALTVTANKAQKKDQNSSVVEDKADRSQLNIDPSDIGMPNANDIL